MVLFGKATKVSVRDEKYELLDDFYQEYYSTKSSDTIDLSRKTNCAFQKILLRLDLSLFSAKKNRQKNAAHYIVWQRFLFEML
jgi:hypothetical protein